MDKKKLIEEHLLNLRICSTLSTMLFCLSQRRIILDHNQLQHQMKVSKYDEDEGCLQARELVYSVDSVQFQTKSITLVGTTNEIIQYRFINVTFNGTMLCKFKAF